MKFLRLESFWAGTLSLSLFFLVAVVFVFIVFVSIIELIVFVFVEVLDEKYLGLESSCCSGTVS